MNTIFMNSENCRTSHPHRLLLNLTDKMDLRKDLKKRWIIKYYNLLYMEKHKKLIH